MELVRTVRTRRSWPRPPVAAFWLRLLADAATVGWTTAGGANAKAKAKKEAKP